MLADLSQAGFGPCGLSVELISLKPVWVGSALKRGNGEGDCWRQ
jgi:hypothetical protein